MILPTMTPPPIDITSLIDLADRQLDRILAFFPRVESKASLLFAIDTSMLAVLALNVTKSDFIIWYLAVSALLALGLIAASLWFLYKCTFPNLKGGAASLVYFRGIATKTEANFIDQFQKQTSDAYVRDLLGQIWRNSEILKMKFDSVKTAFILTAIALIPWVLFLILATLAHARIPAITYP